MSADLPPLREIIAQHGLGARKSLGQHFLLDLNITRKIARAADIASGDLALEIGPGPGGLTRALLEAGAAVVAVERDRRCVEALGALAAAYPGKLTLVEDDALRFDERTIAGERPIKIIANLPYNISTELLVKWLRANNSDGMQRKFDPAYSRESRSPENRHGMDSRFRANERLESSPPNVGPPPTARLWSLMALMFQKEVADRILAAPGSKAYGRLSVIARAASRPERAFDLPARAFTPPPKVQSSVVLFRPADAPLENFAALESVTRAAFGQRRKMLRSSMKSLWGDGAESVLRAAGIASTERAEDVSVEEFLKLADAHAAREK